MNDASPALLVGAIVESSKVAMDSKGLMMEEDSVKAGKGDALSKSNDAGQPHLSSASVILSFNAINIEGHIVLTVQVIEVEVEI